MYKWQFSLIFSNGYFSETQSTCLVRASLTCLAWYKGLNRKNRRNGSEIEFFPKIPRRSFCKSFTGSKSEMVFKKLLWFFNFVCSQNSWTPACSRCMVLTPLTLKLEIKKCGSGRIKEEDVVVLTVPSAENSSAPNPKSEQILI